MKDALKSLEERKGQLAAEMRSLVEAAEGEERQLAEFTAEEETKWEKLNDDLKSVDARMKDIMDAEAREADLAESRSKYENALKGKGDGERKGEETELEERLRLFLRASMPDATEWGPKSITIKGEKGAYRKAQEAVETRTLSKLTAGAGANLVQTDFLQRLYEHQIESSTIRAAGATVITTDSGEAIQLPRTGAHGGAALVAEAGTIGASDPTFTQLTLDAYKYGVLIQVSNELVTDTQFDLVDYLARQAGRAVGNASGAHFITGTGSSQPNGLFTAATTGVTMATGNTTTVTADALMDLYHSVLSPYRGSAAWIMNDAAVKGIRKLKTGVSGDNTYIWQPGLVAGAPDMLLGAPVYTDPNVAAPAASAKTIGFGDVSAYYIRDVNGIRFERSDDFAFNQDLVTFRCLQRTDGDLVDTAAFKVLVQSAT